MKQVFAVSLESETIKKIREAARKGHFRNHSHVVEEAVKNLLREEGRYKENDITDN